MKFNIKSVEKTINTGAHTYMEHYTFKVKYEYIYNMIEVCVCVKVKVASSKTLA